jgi:hypothetical protein
MFLAVFQTSIIIGAEGLKPFIGNNDAMCWSRKTTERMFAYTLLLLSAPTSEFHDDSVIKQRGAFHAAI